MLRTRSREELENMLRDTNAMIAAHPFSLESVKAAHEVVENAPRGDREVVSRELAARNLPSLEELGKIQAKHTFSWWRLHRRRRTLLARIERLGG